jgi:hypothetical protein
MTLGTVILRFLMHLVAKAALHLPIVRGMGVGAYLLLEIRR